MLMSVISVLSWWIGHRGFSLRPKLFVRSFVRFIRREDSDKTNQI